MLYSIVGITAIVISIIINIDSIFSRNEKSKTPAKKAYKYFVFSVIVFFITDSFWGILYDAKLITLVYIDTVFYFIAMGISVLLWTIFVKLYLEEKIVASKILIYIGLVIFIFTFIIIIINIFKPILFTINENCEYSAKEARYLLLVMQFVMFIISSLYAFIMGHNTKGAVKGRYNVIGIFGVIMAVAITTQTMFPLLPLYSIGCVIGITLIHSFVLESEKKEYQKSLEELIYKEQEQEKDLESTKTLVYTDSLTGAKSRHAYVEMEEKIDNLIASKAINKFAVVVFDVNGLKTINDTKGHKDGDDYIKDCYKAINDVYKNVPIYRFGGDEFVAILRNEDYDEREKLLKEFETLINNNLNKNLAIVSSGMSEFNEKEDNTYRAVFMRADKKMYERKVELKKKVV